ncbi:hypothetical protein I7I51_07891 [Histoplasma capsulatum]|uniref:Uncharacterized protein n=1 Tax=Ajellomyces capsulatus TaxID=5037 RepID=A0A8A1LYY1_AJECA|nr:hypothetical protein I7I51_07891 [Histoplasma capsulatum]
MAGSFEKNSREVGTLSQPGRRLLAGVCMNEEEEEEDDEAGRKSGAPIFQISRIGAEQPGYPRLLVGGNEHWGLASVVIALIFTPDADKARRCMYGRIDASLFSSIVIFQTQTTTTTTTTDDYEDEMNSLLHPHGRRRFENAVKATKVQPSTLERQTRPRAARSQCHWYEL